MYNAYHSGADMGKEPTPDRVLIKTTERPMVEEHLKSVFPEGTIERVEVLQYGDDPVIEPGETAIRVFIDRAGRPEGKEADEEAIEAFGDANRAVIRKLHDGLPRAVGWIEFAPGGQPRGARAGGPMIRIGGRGGRGVPLDEAGELTPVMTRLGPADLATVDMLITAGIATSRAEVLRWALGRIREHPAYAQIQERVHEIDDLKAQF
jgi:hypothetical protein